MKAIIHREGFLSAFQLASVAVASKDVKPILRNLKAMADGERCTLMATDLELGIRLDVRGIKVQEPGDAILPATKTLAILRESADEELVLDADAERCLVRGQHNEFEMTSEDPAHFPDVPQFNEEKYHELPAGVLREMIRRTIFSAAAENPRYALVGCLWELSDKHARIVATDGRRLAVCDAPAVSVNGHSTEGQTPVVPTKAMTLLERNLTDANEVVRVCLRPSDAMFKTDRAIIYSRLVEGRYPAYREVIPKKVSAKIPLTVAPFLSAIRQSAIMTDEESKRVEFCFAKNKLMLQAKGVTSGRSKVEMPIEYDGKEIKINFDPKYITEMLRVLEPDAALVLEMADGNTPAILRHGDNYLYVIMPLT